MYSSMRARVCVCMVYSVILSSVLSWKEIKIIRVASHVKKPEQCEFIFLKIASFRNFPS